MMHGHAYCDQESLHEGKQRTTHVDMVSDVHSAMLLPPSQPTSQGGQATKAVGLHSCMTSCRASRQHAIVSLLTVLPACLSKVIPVLVDGKQNSHPWHDANQTNYDMNQTCMHLHSACLSAQKGSSYHWPLTCMIYVCRTSILHGHVNCCTSI